jgi:hypothetical protein
MGTVAIVVGLAVASTSLLGPLVFSVIRYRWAPYSSTIVMGQDFFHLFLVVPICLAGGFLRLRNSPKAKFLLITLGPYLIYQFLLLAIAPEWAHPAYTMVSHTSQNFFWLYLIVIAGGLLILFDSLSQVLPEESPRFSPGIVKAIFAYVALFAVILSFLWVSQILTVSSAGGAVNYDRAPTVFWWIRIFDLGLVIPLAIISLYTYATRPRTGGYGILLLGMGSLMLAFPVVAGSLLFAYFLIPNSANALEVGFFVLMTVPIFPAYIYLVKPRFLSTAM